MGCGIVSEIAEDPLSTIYFSPTDEQNRDQTNDKINNNKTKTVFGMIVVTLCFIIQLLIALLY